MTSHPISSSANWGTRFTVEDADLEFIYNLLLERETPLTAPEMAEALIRYRFERETKAQAQRQQGVTTYLPKETYSVGQTLTFPALNFASGAVVAVRAGHNDNYGAFDVIAIDFGNERPREFAARLESHKLNQSNLSNGDLDLGTPEAMLEHYSETVAQKLEARLTTNPDIVRLAGRWFPRSLLITINVGHLNLAEAVLDMAGGGPLPTEDLLKELGLTANADQRLQVFSLNAALQSDERFDEVGPAGQVLWFLRRLEPAEIISKPARLASAAPAYDHSKLTPTLLALEQEIEDELSPEPENIDPNADVRITLTFPHRRTGTLPLSHRLQPLFPTANVTPRIRFTFVDGDTGEKFPGWVAREGRYVLGLAEWYKQLDFPVGGSLTVKRSEMPGEVILKSDKRRPVREWVRTATVSTDNRLLFTMQKKQIAVNYDDLMMVAVDHLDGLDHIWQRYQDFPFGRLMVDVFRELAKLNPQSAVHAKTLYAAINMVRRCPPGPIFAELLNRSYYAHVGDAYWRFDQAAWAE